MLKLLRKTPQDVKILNGPFKGARVFLNPANSKRKLVGLYENCLNDWIAETAPNKDFVFDVGSNTGYDLYGLAHLVSHKNSRAATIVGFEPEADNFPELSTPIGWPEYSNCNIEIIKKFAGSQSSETSATIDECYSERPDLSGQKGLIKIDVEGAEAEVLKGATSLLDNQDHDWLIEIHGKDLISAVAEPFVKRSRSFLIKELKPLPIIGKESRSIDTYWLVTI